MKFSLPTSTNARNIVPTATTKTQYNFSTPINKVSYNLPELIGNTRVENSQFLKTLQLLNTPINRLGDIKSASSSLLKEGLDALNVNNVYQNVLKTRILKELNSSISVSSMLGNLTVKTDLSELDPVRKISNSLITSTNNLFDTTFLSLNNANLGMSLASVAVCGILDNLFNGSITSLCSTALQLQRSAIAKLDSISKEAIEVIKKQLSLSILPEIDINLDWPAEVISEKFKSVLGQISKLGSLISIPKGSSECNAALNSAVSIITLVDTFLGENASDKLSHKDSLFSIETSGNLGNTQYYLRTTYPNLRNDTLKTQTQESRKAIDLDTNELEKNVDKSLNKIKEDISNVALEELLNPEIDDIISEITVFYEQIGNILLKIKDIKEQLEKDYEDYLNEANTNSQQSTDYVKAIQGVNELEKNLIQINSDINEISNNVKDDTNKNISDNYNIITNTIDNINNEIHENLDSQKDEIDMIFDSLERDSEYVDQQTPKVYDNLDTSCK